MIFQRLKKAALLNGIKGHCFQKRNAAMISFKKKLLFHTLTPEIVFAIIIQTEFEKFTYKYNLISLIHSLCLFQVRLIIF